MTLTQINKAGLDELALDHVFTIGASGSSAYTFQGEGLNGTVNNPTLYLTRGKTYRFENGSGGHPIRIQSTSGASGTAYNTGVTNNAGSGTVIVEVQHDAPDVLYYQCTSHAAMNGILYITGALADGGVTTAKIADDAVTDAKLANSINSAIAANTAKTSLEDNSVTTAKIADQAVTLAKLPHGTSSNDGKFLRANNGADPTFETVSAGPTIANQANNRVITATGTTDALNAESNVVIDANGRLGIGESSPSTPLHVKHATTNGVAIFESGDADGGIALKDNSTSANVFLLASGNDFYAQTNGSERMRIDSSGKVSVKTNGLNLENASATSSRAFSITNASGTTGWTFGNGVLGSSHQFVIYDNSAGAGRMLIDSNGIARFNNGIQLGNGLTNSTAHQLDDYEEGTFTPAFGSGYSYASTITYSQQAGFYTKIGNQVFCQVYLRPNGNSAHSGNVIEDGNSLYVSGLPFTSNSTNYSEGGGFITYQSGFFDTSGTANANLHAMPWVSRNGTTVYFHSPEDGNNVRGNETNPTNNYLVFQVHYTV